MSYISTHRLLVQVSLGFLGLFLYPRLAFAAGERVVISEIAAFEATSEEWVEIYNAGVGPVDLSSWRFVEGGINHVLTPTQGTNTVLPQGSYAIIAQDANHFFVSHPNTNILVLDSSWGTLNESGEDIGLKNTLGEFVDRAIYPSASNHSLERLEVGSGVAGGRWQEHVSGSTIGSGPVIIFSEAPGTPTPPPPPPAQNQNGGDISVVRINEFVADPLAGEREWIELYNPSTQSVVLTNATLKDSVQTIQTLTGVLASNGYLVIELATTKLNNTGDSIILLSESGAEVDRVSYSDDSDLSLGDKGQSLGRTPDGQDTDTVSDFHILTPTKGMENSSPAPSSETPDEGGEMGSDTNDDHETYPLSYESGAVVINELVSDPADGAVEFVELYNRFGKPISLTGWRLLDGNGAATILTGTLDAYGFLVIEKPKGGLNNSGDRVALLDPNALTIDLVCYGTWVEECSPPNAPVAADPQSLARRHDGEDSGNAKNDFVLTSSITKGQPNRVLSATQPLSHIFISELLADPIGSDLTGEFIELTNTKNEIANLEGWQLGREGGRLYTFPKGTMLALGQTSFTREVTGITLPNTGNELVVLLSPEGDMVDTFSYTQSKEGYAFIKNEFKKVSTTKTPTPGKENIITADNHVPLSTFDLPSEIRLGETLVLDGSDSEDDDGDTLSFSWTTSIGDVFTGAVVSTRFFEVGDTEITLVVTDSKGGTHSSKKHILVTGKGVAPEGESATAENVLSDTVTISELYPGPVRGEEEFIELVNHGGVAISLSGYILEDASRRRFSIPQNTTLQPNTALAFFGKTTRISLNNDGDTITLRTPQNTQVGTMVYEKAIAGKSVERRNDKLFWFTPTPHTISTEQPSAPVLNDTKTVPSKSKISGGIETILSARSKKKDSIVTVEGVVASVPGVLGSQVFTLVDTENAHGIEIYLNSKAFPKLTLGDHVRVTGVVSAAYNNIRLNAKQGTNIVRLAQGTPPTPKLLDIRVIGEEAEGRLVEVHGEITEKKTGTFFVDDSTDEIKVVLKEGAHITEDTLTPGSLVRVSGVVVERQGVYELWPRDMSDIDIRPLKKTIDEQATSSASRTAITVAHPYRTITLGGIVSFFLGVIVRTRGLIALALLKRGGRTLLTLLSKFRG